MGAGQLRRNIPFVAFGVLLIGAAVFVQLISGQLPERVATHFDATGHPNGFMTRESCRIFMLTFTLGFPLFIAAVTGLIPWLVPPSLVNLPNRAYWLAPERAQQSRAFLSVQGIWFGCILLVFLSSVDWLVVNANSTVPAQLPLKPFVTAMVLFFTVVGFWMVRMFRHFRKPPE
jgi:uncharacterized membrane protein